MAEEPLWFADPTNSVWRHPDGRTESLVVEPPPTVQHNVLMGVGGNPATGTGGTGKTHIITGWDAERIYNASQSQATAAINRGSKVLAVTAESGTTIAKTGAAAATQLDAYLDWFYYGSGSAARQTTEVHYANGNEENRAQAQNGQPLASAYFSACLDQYEVVHTTVGGVRRYPMASYWMDLTCGGIKDDNHGPTWLPMADRVDGLAMSMYPPRRQDNPCNFCGYKSGWTPQETRWNYDFYCIPVLNFLQGLLDRPNSKVTSFATWEIASPVEGAWYAASQTAANYSVRPRYFTGGVDSHGHNHLGFLQYMYDQLDAMGVAMREQLWWDENIQYPNNFFWDGEGQIPSLPQGTARAWHDWQPGVRLPNA